MQVMDRKGRNAMTKEPFKQGVDKSVSQMVPSLSSVNHTESGLRDTCINRYIVEMTKKADIRPEEQWEGEELPGEYMVWKTQ